MKKDWIAPIVELFSKLSTTSNDATEAIGEPSWRILALKVNEQEVASTKYVYDNWDKRKPDFFPELNPKGTLTLLKYDLKRQKKDFPGVKPSKGQGLVPHMTKEEFHSMSTLSCAFFAECFDWLESPDFLPPECVEYLLRIGDLTISGFQKIPVEWLKVAGKLFIINLTAEHFKLVPVDVFAAWIAAGKCGYFKLEALNVLGPSYWQKVTAECMVKISNFSQLELSPEIVSVLKPDIFSLYNGSLHDETTKALTPAQVAEYSGRLPKRGGTICGDLRLDLLSIEAIAQVRPWCLYGYLSSTLLGESRLLGERWRVLTLPLLKFNDEMLFAISNVNANDYKFIPVIIIERIFGSKKVLARLPMNYSELPIIADSIRLSSVHFKNLIDTRGAIVTGELLSRSQVLPNDTFAFFEAEDYIKLEEYSDGENWKLGRLPASLIERSNFGSIITNLSVKAKTHYCSNLKSVEEYLEKLWLREHSGPNCWSALPFKADFLLSLQAPELARGELSWYEFVEKHLDNLRRASHEDLKDLLQMESFCRALGTLGDEGFLEWRPDLVLKVIGGKCAAYLHKIISPDFADRLADDAFQYFTFEMFFPRFKPADLTSNQIKYISEGLPKGSESHVFKRILSRFLINLDNSRLEAITPYQLQVYVNDRNPEPPLSAFLAKKAFIKKDRGLLRLALNLCELRLKNIGHADCNCLRALERHVDAHRNSPWPLFRKTLLEFELASISLAQKPSDLRKPMLRSGFPSKIIKFHLSNFDWLESFTILKDHFEDFAHPLMQVEGPFDLYGSNDNLQEFWVVKLFDYVKSKFTFPVSKSNRLIRRFLKGGPEGTGKLIGMLFGKAVQIKAPLPFELEESFWNLLIHHSSSAVDNYHKNTFKTNFEEFHLRLQSPTLEDKPHVKDSFSSPSPSPPPSPFASKATTRPNSMEISTRPMADNILYNPQESDHSNDSCLFLIDNFESENQIESFLLSNPRSSEKFATFIREFLEGLGLVIHTEYFKFLRNSSNFIGLFKGFNLPAEAFLQAIMFSDQVDNTMVESLIEGYEISMSDVIRSFIKTLNPNQLLIFLLTWTGSSSLSSKSPPKASLLVDQDSIEIVIQNFTPSDLEISSSTEYSPLHEVSTSQVSIFAIKQFERTLRAAISSQCELLNLASCAVLPESLEESFAFIQQNGFIKSKILMDKKLLSVYPQPALTLLYSLAVLANVIQVVHP